MTGSSIAQSAAEYLRQWNDGLDTDDDQDWSLDCSMGLSLYQIRRAASPDGNHPHSAARIRKSVLDALANTEDGRRLFECRRIPALYPCITNGVTRVFVLKEEHRRP